MKNLLFIVNSLIFVVILACNNEHSRTDYTIRILYPSNKDTVISYYENGNKKWMKIKDSTNNKIIIYDYYQNGELKRYSIGYKIDSNKYQIFFEREYLDNRVEDKGHIIGAILIPENNLSMRKLLIARPPHCVYSIAAIVDSCDTSFLKLKNNYSYFKIPDTTKELNITYIALLKDTLLDTLTWEEVGVTTRPLNRE